VRFFRFSRKQLDVFAPIFFQGLEKTLVYYNLHWKAICTWPLSFMLYLHLLKKCKLWIEEGTHLI